VPTISPPRTSPHTHPRFTRHEPCAGGIPAAKGPDPQPPPAALRGSADGYADRAAGPAPVDPGHPEPSEDELCGLLRRAVHGDQAAWTTIVARYNPLLWSVTRQFRLTHEQAADAVQTTWLLLVEHIARIRDPRRLSGWLRRTVHNLCIRVLRTTARERPLIVDQHDQAVHDGPEPSLLRRDRHAIVRDALGALSHRDRQLLSLLASSDGTYADISRMLDMPVGSIGPTRARALHRLRLLLEARDVGDAALD
jgi:RNA polymerase sigma factor (sigma-70 family)